VGQRGHEVKKSKKTVKDLLSIIALGSVLLLNSQNVTAADQYYPRSYLGIRDQAKHLDWQSGLENNVVKKNLPEGNILGDVKFSQYKLIHKTSIVADSSKGSFNILTTGRNFHHRRTGGAGVQYMPWDCVGFRATLGWENINRFDDLASKKVPTPLLIRMKNKLKPGLSAFVTF